MSLNMYYVFRHLAKILLIATTNMKQTELLQYIT